MRSLRALVSSQDGGLVVAGRGVIVCGLVRA
jgi:hypothetical protein